MTAAKKRIDPDRTAEIVIPEAIQNLTNELKKEKQTLTRELDEAKSEISVRKEDESTRVFNLRQLQMENKIKELENKKAHIEKDLNLIMQQKNGKLHDDLKRLTQLLVLETRKIAPLEKEFGSNMSKITNLKNEMQYLFESSINERKKNSEIQEEQIKQIKQIGTLIQDTSSVLQKDFHLLTQDIAKLNREKHEATIALEKLKEEISRHENTVKDLYQKQEELKQTEGMIASLIKKKDELEYSQKKLASIKEDLYKAESEKEALLNANMNSEQEKIHLTQEKSRVELKIKNLEEQLIRKKEDLNQLDNDIIQTKSELENLKNEIHENELAIQKKKTEVQGLENERYQLEVKKEAETKLYEKLMALHGEKKDSWNHEIELLHETYKAKSSQLESEHETKKLQWEDEFKRFCQSQEKNLHNDLKNIEQKHNEELNKKKNEIVAHLGDILKRQLTREGFVSTEQKVDESRKEMILFFEKIFGKSDKWRPW